MHLSSLQCGRIYKDAEIWKQECDVGISYNLQCGRIYKDAEIVTVDVQYFNDETLQCGRIYKDAEICYSGRLDRRIW